MNKDALEECRLALRAGIQKIMENSIRELAAAITENNRKIVDSLGLSPMERVEFGRRLRRALDDQTANRRYSAPAPGRQLRPGPPPALRSHAPRRRGV